MLLIHKMWVSRPEKTVLIFKSYPRYCVLEKILLFASDIRMKTAFRFILYTIIPTK